MSSVVRIGRKKYQHELVLNLIRSAGGSTDPEILVRAQATGAVNKALTTFKSWSPPPFDPKLLAQVCGIEVEGTLLLPSIDAMLVCRKNKVKILYNTAATSSRRQNFSIAHEIAHTFFPGFESSKYMRQHAGAFDFDSANELENLCDQGAAEMLLPTEYFRQSLSQIPFGIEAVDPLRHLYSASRDAVAFKMVQSGIRRCAAVFFEECLKPSEKARIKSLENQFRIWPGDANELDSLRPKYRVSTRMMSKDFGVFIPKHKSVDRRSFVYRAAEQGTVVRGYERMPFGTGETLFYVEAIPAPRGSDGEGSVRVLALIYPK